MDLGKAIFEGLLSICTRKFYVALHRDLSIEGWQESGLFSRIFVAVAFPPNSIDSKTLPGARVFLY